MNAKTLILILMGSVMMAGLWACDIEDEEAQACSPGDESCVCALEDGTSCDPEVDEACSCSLEESDMPADTNEDDVDDEEEGEEPDEGGEETGTDIVYRFLLIEDLTQGVTGPYPGVDLDAVTLTKAEGGDFYVTGVDDAELADGATNEANNLSAIMGAPDDNCEANSERFVSLGGEGGYIVVSFGTDIEDVHFEEGDTLTIHEIGGTACDGQYDDDPYRASIQVSVMDAQGMFVELGEGDGEATLSVPALP
jgi:hypothetical protein